MNPKATLRRLRYLTASLRRHGAGHVLEVFRQYVRRRRYARSPAGLPSRDELRRQLGDEDILGVLTSQLPARFPLLRSTRKVFLVSLLERTQPYDAIIDEAELFADGRFEALGVSTPGGDYDWNRDWGCGHAWPRVPFNRIEIPGPVGADVKRPWELSRMYWIWWLGKAWILTGNTAWAGDFMRILDSWTNSNPVNCGVNWAMPMEVGIRSFWLTQGFVLFRSAPTITDEWWTDYVRLLWAHGTYLESNLEYFPNLTNHYIANCFGLVSVGAFFGTETDGGRRWLTDGRRRMEAELEHQVCSDGTHYERSLPYHRLVLEMYLASSVLLERAGLPFSVGAREKIAQMAELLVDVMLPDGTIPQIGDADDGVIFRMSSASDPYDASDLAGLAACILRERSMASAAGAYSQSALLLYGAEGYEIFSSIEPQPAAGSKLFAEGGFAVLKAGDYQVVADVGPIGLHGNNDTLSFVLADGDGIVFVDPGTFSYTGDPIRRDELRSSLAHNALVVDGREIAEFDGLWRVRRDLTATRVIAWRTSNGECLLEAGHGAYRKAGVDIVARRWELDDRRLVIRDSVSGRGAHRLSVRFTLAEGIRARRTGDCGVALIRSSGRTIEVTFDHPVTVGSGWYSPRYGVSVETDIIELAIESELPAELVYICRFAPEDPSR